MPYCSHNWNDAEGIIKIPSSSKNNIELYGRGGGRSKGRPVGIYKKDGDELSDEQKEEAVEAGKRIIAEAAREVKEEIAERVAVINQQIMNLVLGDLKEEVTDMDNQKRPKLYDDKKRTSMNDLTSIKGFTFVGYEYKKHINKDISKFTSCIFRDCDFAKATITSTVFKNCIFEASCDFAYTKLGGNEASPSEYIGCEFNITDTILESDPDLAKDRYTYLKSERGHFYRWYKINFSYSILTNCSFKKMNSEEPAFRYSTINNCNFDDSYMANANFTGAKIKNSSFSNVNFIYLDFGDKRDTRTSPLGVIFRTSTIDNTKFDKSYLGKCDLTDVTWTNVNLTSTRLIIHESAKLKGSSIQFYVTKKENLPQKINSHFKCISQMKKIFKEPNSYDANYWYILVGPYMNLKNVDLSDADLNGVRLTGANLENANLTGANLEDATLFESQLDKEKKIGPLLGGPPDKLMADAVFLTDKYHRLYLIHYLNTTLLTHIKSTNKKRKDRYTLTLKDVCLSMKEKRDKVYIDSLQKLKNRLSDTNLELTNITASWKTQTKITADKIKEIKDHIRKFND
uniref:Pentapeptide repeat protein n=1 Tax=Megaviridae environmental sample TaxID=1737588 RepID=A0A5J6VKQ1_9VIRU|nr:MAG: pentapeptide repeat protein [Megaviridae environmental sample]